MIKSIQRLRQFGVFQDFSKTAALPDFAEKNIIYGWNYSGKTTLSRLFGMLSAKAAHRDFPDCAFSVQDSQGVFATETSLSQSPKNVAVFNSDFVAANLSWTGEACEPILLLGDESIEAERKIAALDQMVIRCRNGFRKRQTFLTAAEADFADAKKEGAKRTKQTLQLVEAYSAVHLANDIRRVLPKPELSLLGDEAYKADMILALMAEKNKLRRVTFLTVPVFDISDVYRSAIELVQATPAFSSVINYLKTNPAVSDWVERGLALHNDKINCDFCGNEISKVRIDALHGHFSKDLVNHKDQVVSLTNRAVNLRLHVVQLEPTQFAPAFAKRITTLNHEFTQVIDAYNRDVDQLVSLLREKAEHPFERLAQPVLLPDMAPVLKEMFSVANALIGENNNLSDDFPRQKSAAIERLKSHFAADFYISEHVTQAEHRNAIYVRHRDHLTSIGKRLNSEIAVLYATINRSQKGRERINQRIATLLGSDVVTIDVVKVGDDDRFQLTRAGHPAKNLSDGERTAIAFAYFLTKLEEQEDLRKVIIYIDDPISSLDSNHLFQVFAMIETFFFKMVQGQNNKPTWTTACKQIFISTHNFEFFSLLKSLPGGKTMSRYFLVRRTSSATSTIEDMPASMLQYTSEYHYLFSVIHAFHVSPNKSNVEQLLALPNAMRRFIELYTYMRLPLADSKVGERTVLLFGKEKSERILNLLHHFSHLESIERVATHSHVIADIEAVVTDLLTLVQADTGHYDALKACVA